jgi:hypothetical protein
MRLWTIQFARAVQRFESDFCQDRCSYRSQYSIPLVATTRERFRAIFPTRRVEKNPTAEAVGFPQLSCNTSSTAIVNKFSTT